MTCPPGSLILCAVLLTMTGSATAEKQDLDVTPYLQVLGNPYQSTYAKGPKVYARNIWDMCAFRGRLYLGAGNSSNVGPAANVGPVPIICYDPATKQFSEMLEVDDEQIDIFRCLAGQLYVPGHDPRESWELGNFYRLERDGKWAKHRSIPKGIHNYDMAYRGGTLFAGLGAQSPSIAVSGNLGRTWKVTGPTNWRVSSFLESDGLVYAAGEFPSAAFLAKVKKEGHEIPVSCWEYSPGDGFVQRPDLNKHTLFTNTAVNEDLNTKAVRAVSLKGKAVYIGAYCHNDHQMDPFGVYVAGSLKKGAVDVRGVDLPAGSKPWDLLIYDGAVYALLSKQMGDQTVVLVMRSSDLKHWREVMQFRSATFARSFAILNGDFYFGLGCEIKDPFKWTQDELKPETGTILRVDGRHARKDRG